jgi:hypothetical protein
VGVACGAGERCDAQTGACGADACLARGEDCAKFAGSACAGGSCSACAPEGDGQDMAAVAAFAGTPTFQYGEVTATTGGAGALSVCMSASAAAAVGTAPESEGTSPTVVIGDYDSTAAISLTIDCVATSELCRVRRPAPRTQPFLRRRRSSVHRPV